MPPLPKKEQALFIRKHLGVDPPLGVPVNDAENARLAALPPEQLVLQDLTVGDMEELFSEDYMLSLKTMEFDYLDAPVPAGGLSLKDIMKRIDQPSPMQGDERVDILTQLAAIVSSTPAKMETDYARFLVLKEQQKANKKEHDKAEAKAKKEEKAAKKEAEKSEDYVEALDNEKFPDFMASRGQMLFGAVLGKAFGIHEVFASLLSSTGGLIGPGNEAVQWDSNNPISLHGTVHDAAGYLLNYHNDGPGYNYRESPLELLSSTNPLAGQHSGIAFWMEHEAREQVKDAVEDQLQKYVDLADFGADIFEGSASIIDQGTDMLVDGANAVDDFISDKVDDLADAVGDGADFAADGVDAVMHGAADMVGDGADAVARGVSGVADGIADSVSRVTDAVGADFVGDAVESVADGVGAVAEGTADAVEFVADKVADGAALAADGVAYVTKKGADLAAGAVDLATDAASGAVEMGTDAVDFLAEKTADLARFAADGVEGAQEMIAEAAGYIAGKPTAAVSEALVATGVYLKAGYDGAKEKAAAAKDYAVKKYEEVKAKAEAAGDYVKDRYNAAKTTAMGALDSLTSGFTSFFSSKTEPAPKPGKDPVGDSKAVAPKAKKKRSSLWGFLGF